MALIDERFPMSPSATSQWELPSDLRRMWEWLQAQARYAQAGGALDTSAIDRAGSDASARLANFASSVYGALPPVLSQLFPTSFMSEPGWTGQPNSVAWPTGPRPGASPAQRPLAAPAPSAATPPAASPATVGTSLPDSMRSFLGGQSVVAPTGVAPRPPVVPPGGMFISPSAYSSGAPPASSGAPSAEPFAAPPPAVAPPSAVAPPVTASPARPGPLQRGGRRPSPTVAAPPPAPKSAAAIAGSARPRARSADLPTINRPYSAAGPMIFEPPFTAPMTSVTGEVMEGAAPNLGILTPTERAAPPTKIASAAGRWDIPAMPRLGAPERAEQAMATGALRTGAPRLSGRDIMKTLFLDKDWAKMSAAEEMNRRAVETEAWIAQQPPEMQPQLASILAPRITAAREAYAKMQKEQELTAQEQGKGRALEALSPEERLRAQAGQPFGEAMRMPLEVQKEANIGAANVANINAAAEVTSATKQADAIIEANRINRQGMIDQARIGNQGALMEVMMKSYQQDLSQGMPWEIAYHRNQAVAKSWISGQPIEMPPEMKKREEDWLSSYRDFQIRLKRGDADDIIFQKAVEATKDMDLADREEFLQMIQSMLRSRGTMPEGGPPPGAPTSGAEVPYGPETRPSIGQEASQMLGELGSVYGDLYGGSSAPMGSALYPFAWTQAALGRAGEALGNWASSQPNPYGLGPLPFPPGVKPPGVR